MNNKSWLAIKVITLLYQLAQDKPVRLTDISQLAGTSISYTEQLFRKFREAGLVVSAKGPGGGYSIVHRDISVTEVIKAIENLPEYSLYAPIAAALNKVMIEQLAKQTQQRTTPKNAIADHDGES